MSSIRDVNRSIHMLSGTGRPRKACNTCKAQKIRCSAERPSCKRCIRLRHHCVYSTNSRDARSSVPHLLEASTSPLAHQHPAQSKASGRASLSSAGSTMSTAVPLVHQPAEARYHGIPKSLMAALVEVYYENVYNAPLLLHKRLFLESLAVGTAPAHVVLSVCASAANFYRDADGKATLRDHGFMLEWAQRAGNLVFLEAESLREDNIVTHINLCLLWHSQGNWRICYLHKGAAGNLLHILGPGSGSRRSQDPWASEIRRRRFWACYQAHCHSSECYFRFEPASNLEELALPWPEEDFEAGVSHHPPVTLASGRSNGGIFSEIVKVFTLWSSVVSHIKTSEPDLSVRVPAIHGLAQKLSDWWQKLRPDFQLTPLNISSISDDAFPKVLLMNIAYHQSLCALHASIVPIFCWGEGAEDWLSARQLSAQCAYEHACASSELLRAVLGSYDRLSAMPSFVSYAAYCGCAIQIPFLWSTSPAVRQRAVTNVRANVQMIDTIAEDWKFAALLKIYVRCLHNGHKKHPTVLENEPRFVDPRKLTNFKVSAPYAQASILEFASILRREDGGYVISGDEAAELEVDQQESNPADREWTAVQREGPTASGPEVAGASFLPLSFSDPTVQQPASAAVHQQEQQPLSSNVGQVLPVPAAPNHTVVPESQNLDIFHPLLDPEMLELFPDGELPDLSVFETSPLNLDYLDMADWDSAAGGGDTAGAHMAMSEWNSIQ